MHKTSLLCAFLARMRAALCLLENKHLRASEPSDSTSLFLFLFFSALRREKRGMQIRRNEGTIILILLDVKDFYFSFNYTLQ